MRTRFFLLLLCLINIGNIKSIAQEQKYKLVENGKTIESNLSLEKCKEKYKERMKKNLIKDLNPPQVSLSSNFESDAVQIEKAAKNFRPTGNKVVCKCLLMNETGESDSGNPGTGSMKELGQIGDSNRWKAGRQEDVEKYAPKVPDGTALNYDKQPPVTASETVVSKDGTDDALKALNDQETEEEEEEEEKQPVKEEAKTTSPSK